MDPISRIIAQQKVANLGGGSVDAARNTKPVPTLEGGIERLNVGLSQLAEFRDRVRGIADRFAGAQPVNGTAGSPTVPANGAVDALHQALNAWSCLMNEVDEHFNRIARAL